jgi:hypothetical protein
MSETTRQETFVTLRETTSSDGIGEGVRLARSQFLDELPGAVFAGITLIWIAFAFVSLIRMEVIPSHLIDHARTIMDVTFQSSAIRTVSRSSSAVGFLVKTGRFIYRRKVCT